MLPENPPEKSETLWDVYKDDTKKTSILNQEADISTVNPEALLIAASPDWLWKILTYGFGSFFLAAMLIFGGRDILLLTGRNQVQASLVGRGAPVDCSTRRYRNRTCQELTYTYVADGKTYQFSINASQAYLPAFTIEYVTWAPRIYKKHLDKR